MAEAAALWSGSLQIWIDGCEVVQGRVNWFSRLGDGDSSSSGLGGVGRGTRQWLGICNGADWKHGFMDWVSPVGFFLMMEIGIL
ncbi:hypothetical protein M0R45_030593 [Rubus argutus]|uniref:Uncharacterized protein n=1 Tax=Rubus argutus TaxID=59490 RepID=A0AAW1WDH5_RUBAR